MDEEDEGSKFCEEDIDQILQRRTKTITIESEGRGSTFAKVRLMRTFRKMLAYHVFKYCFKGRLSKKLCFLGFFSICFCCPW